MLVGTSQTAAMRAASVAERIKGNAGRGFDFRFRLGMGLENMTGRYHMTYSSVLCHSF